jgi:hypothetical protein
MSNFIMIRLCLLCLLLVAPFEFRSSETFCQGYSVSRTIPDNVTRDLVAAKRTLLDDAKLEYTEIPSKQVGRADFVSLMIALVAAPRLTAAEESFQDLSMPLETSSGAGNQTPEEVGTNFVRGQLLMIQAQLGRCCQEQPHGD